MYKVYMGVDAGPSTGIALLFIYDDGHREWRVFQCNADTAYWLIQELYTQFLPRVVGIEKFGKTSKRNSASDEIVTRRVAEHAYLLVPSIKRVPAAVARYRLPGEVKPWATDKRLEEAGFPLGPKFKDARDAGRHALFAAVRDGKERDPLA